MLIAESGMFLARRLETRNGEAGARQRPITVSLSRSHSASDLTCSTHVMPEAESDVNKRGLFSQVFCYTCLLGGFDAK